MVGWLRIQGTNNIAAALSVRLSRSLPSSWGQVSLGVREDPNLIRAASHLVGPCGAWPWADMQQLTGQSVGEGAWAILGQFGKGALWPIEGRIGPMLSSNIRLMSPLVPFAMQQAQSALAILVCHGLTGSETKAQRC